MIREYFLEAVLRYERDQHKADELWLELSEQYTHPARYYHSLVHLDAVLQELLPHRKAFTNFDGVICAVAYHDGIYNPLKSNNEEKSAALAVKRLTAIGFPTEEINRCATMILATKKHEPADEETNLFTDADLSILGATPDVYQQYTEQVRREYSMYPDFLYKPGRRKILQHFLSMKTIFKTGAFRNLYETQTRINLEAELQKL